MANKSVNIFKPDMNNLYIYMNIEEESLKNKSLNWLPVANCFSGREDIFKEIKKEFTDKKCVVLHGMPGIGKTETARQFGSRNCDFFNGNLIWIFSETSDNIKQCFVNLATALHLKITDASLIFNQFKTSKALIIFDNAESMAAIKGYLPSKQLHPTVYVLITSPLANWGPSTSISKIRLNPLNMKDAISIFKQKIGDKFDEYKPEKWKELVRKLDGIPLCIQIVSSLIQQEVCRIRLTEFNLENFIDEMEAKLISSTTSEFEQDYDQKSVFAAINSVLSRFEEVEAILSLDLLCFLAYLDADFIYDDVLLLIPSIEKSKPHLEEALNKLVDYSLIQVVKDSYFSRLKIKVHRTVQLALREYDLKKRNGDMFKTLLRLSMFGKIILHLLSLFKYANKKEFLEKTIEFYNEHNKNEFPIEKYVWQLVDFNCDGALQIILPELKNNRTDEFIDMLLRAINWARDMKTIKVFLKVVAQNEEDVRQIEDLPDWRSTKLIDIILESNILKNRENVILKNSTTGNFLHLLVKKSHKANVRETFECIKHLISKWGADILYQDVYFRNNNILHTACLNSKISLEIIEYLFQLENGKLKEIVNCQNIKKQTPLHTLFDWNNNNPDIFQIFRYFINERQVDITRQDCNKENILFYICRYGSFEIIDFILGERDCSQIINNQDDWGDVAFSKLIIWNESIEEDDKIKLLDLFLKHGMDIYLKNKQNKTLLEIAKEKGLRRCELAMLRFACDD